MLTVYANDGSGTLDDRHDERLGIPDGEHAYVFTVTAAAGGMSGGTVTLVVPAGWSAPSVTGSAAGYTTASVGHGHGRNTDNHRLCA